MSPFIHSELFRMSGVEAEYDVTEIYPDDLKNKVEMLRELNGYNVTIPYKREIIPYLDELDESAARYNAVNCVRNHKGKAIGYNTDCDGFLMSVKSLPLSGKVLIVGCGGVGRMMAIEAAIHNADLTIGIIPEASEAAADLCDEIHTLTDSCKVRVKNITTVSGAYDLIVNASPVGMYPKTDVCPVSEEVIEKCSSVFDAVYNPIETKFIKYAKSFGKTAVNGTAMLVYQAVKAHEIWNDCYYSDEQINDLIERTNKIIAGE